MRGAGGGGRCTERVIWEDEAPEYLEIPSVSVHTGDDEKDGPVDGVTSNAV